MEHISHDWTGWFSFPKFYAQQVARLKSGTMVEIGTYEGKSLAYLVVEVINSGKPIEVIGIDAFPWDGLEEKFKSNMQTLNGKYTYHKAESSESAKLFQNESLDFVFIDANHTYEFVKRDILAYLPKMKKGAVIAGHDYNHHHPGVIQAVDEIFNKQHTYNEDEDVWHITVQ